MARREGLEFTPIDTEREYERYLSDTPMLLGAGMDRWRRFYDAIGLFDQIRFECEVLKARHVPGGDGVRGAPHHGDLDALRRRGAGRAHRVGGRDAGAVHVRTPRRAHVPGDHERPARRGAGDARAGACRRLDVLVHLGPAPPGAVAGVVRPGGGHRAVAGPADGGRRTATTPSPTRSRPRPSACSTAAR
ncbi:hypothetical protein ACFSTC_39880 [Nonomuraea ferruginea]